IPAIPAIPASAIRRVIPLIDPRLPSHPFAIRTRFYGLRFPLGNRILLAAAPLVALPIDWYG
ncbi:MAG: hypothetical protein CMJ69_19655, partial [Planctomycetaceae bacterium]|nr:hypothetical protein [Planctomycetaceae bacterium]